MKRILFSMALLLILANVSLQAQLTDPLSKAAGKATAQAGPGKLLTQFVSALKPTSLLGSWAGEKNSWLSKAGKVADAAVMVSSISSLAGFIKPDMFKTGFSAARLLETANTVKTMTGAAGLLKNLEGGLKPAALSSVWGSQRSGWLNALNLLK